MVLKPFLEGAERINRAFQGIEELSFAKQPLSSQERVISLIEGIFLMIPFINAILWMALEQFCNAPSFTDAYLIGPEQAEAYFVNDP